MGWIVVFYFLPLMGLTVNGFAPRGRSDEGVEEHWSMWELLNESEALTAWAPEITQKVKIENVIQTTFFKSHPRHMSDKISSYSETNCKTFH
jgi:hypothetical protein